MVVLTEADVGSLRVKLANRFPEIGEAIDFDVDTINTVFQALEDWIQTNQVKNAVSNTINAATSHAFTGPQKKLIFAVFIFNKAFREGLNG